MALGYREGLIRLLVFLCFVDAVCGKEYKYKPQDIWQYVITPFITCAIGYGTNMVAGIFPKRQDVLAEKVGETVSTRLLTHSDIREYMLKDNFQKSLVPVVEKIVDTLLTTGLNEVHPQFELILATAKTLKENLKKDFVAEVVEALPMLTNKISEQMERTTKIDEMVSEKIKAMSLDDMERMFLDFMEEEFKFIEFLGGFLGFFVGLIQALVMYFTD